MKPLRIKIQDECVSYRSINDFFTFELEKEAYQHWQKTLGTLIAGLPECTLVLQETKELISKAIFLT